MDPADIPTIEYILTDYGLDDILEPNLYQDLLARLQTRESYMVTDARFSELSKFSEGLDKIIREV